MHQSSLENMKNFREKYLVGRETEKLLILDLGSCDINGSYKPLFDEPTWSYRGLDLQEGSNVDMVLRDPYKLDGVPSDSVDVFVSGHWKRLSRGQVIGYKRICCVPEVETDRVRIVLFESRAPATLSTVGLFLQPDINTVAVAAGR